MELIQRDAFGTDEPATQYVIAVSSDLCDFIPADMQLQATGGFAKRTGSIFDSFVGFLQGEALPIVYVS